MDLVDEEAWRLRRRFIASDTLFFQYMVIEI